MTGTKKLTAHDLSLVFKKSEQDTVFIFGKIYFFTVEAESCIGYVEHCAFVDDDICFRAEVVCSAQYRLDLCHKHGQVKGLSDKIISAHIHCHHNIHIVRGGG